MNRKLVLNFVFFIISLECWIHSSEYTQAALSCIHFRVFSTPVQLFKIQSSALFLRFITYNNLTFFPLINWLIQWRFFRLKNTRTWEEPPPLWCWSIWLTAFYLNHATCWSSASSAMVKNKEKLSLLMAILWMQRQTFLGF